MGRSSKRGYQANFEGTDDNLGPEPENIPEPDQR